MRSRKRSSVRLLFVAIAIAPAWSLGACSEEDPPVQTGSAQDCRLIANRCHYYDRDGGSALAHDCHEIGHDAKDLAQCTAMKESCLAECPERDAGETGGSGGAGNDAASDAGGAGTGGAGTGGTAGGDAGEDSSPDAAGASGSGGTAGVAGTGGAAGSGGNGGHGGATGTACDQLGSICHDVPGAFPEHCHDLGHALDEPACEAELAACLAACRDAGS